jgi:hypothetical protein
VLLSRQAVYLNFRKFDKFPFCLSHGSETSHSRLGGIRSSDRSPANPISLRHFREGQRNGCILIHNNRIHAQKGILPTYLWE